eukprot:scaffold29486_cov48-Phaeocystis_antarctica.AAC.2
MADSDQPTREEAWVHVPDPRYDRYGFKRPAAIASLQQEFEADYARRISQQERRCAMSKAGPAWTASAARAADWPRLAEAPGSLEHELALKEALGRQLAEALAAARGDGERGHVADQGAEAAGPQRDPAREAW